MMSTQTTGGSVSRNHINQSLPRSHAGSGKPYPAPWQLPLLILGLVTMLYTTSGWCQASMTSSPNEATNLTEKWGIEILGVRQSAAGHMLDFRYRVVDAEKASPLFVRQTKPYLIDQASGKVLAVPNLAKVGPLRSSNQPQAGRTYWMFFGNPGVVKAGGKVSVVIGDFKVENLTVQ